MKDDQISMGENYREDLCSGVHLEPDNKRTDSVPELEPRIPFLVLPIYTNAREGER